MTAISPGVGNSWQASFADPRDGTTGTVTDLQVSQNTVVVYVGARSLSGTYGVGSAGGYVANGNAGFNATVATRGQAGAGQSPATDFGPWGGSLAFDSFTNWHFGLTAPPTSKVDFLTVAEHELARVFGFGTSASWNARVTGGAFTGSTATGLYGGPIPLDPADLKSWESGTTYDGRVTLMVPDIPLGRRREFSELDFAGLADVGWQVTPVPEPAAAVMVAVVGLAAVWCGRWRKCLPVREQ